MIYRLSFLSVLFGMLTSCAFHSGMMTSGTGFVTNPNFAIVGYAQGFANTKHILGVGGLNRNALIHEAKQNLYTMYNLEPGQVLGQTTIDFKRIYVLPFYVGTQVFVSAEILQLYDPPVTSAITEQQNAFWETNTFLPWKTPTKTILDPEKNYIQGTDFYEGEKVKFKHTLKEYEGVIMEGMVKERNGKFIMVFYLDSDGKQKGIYVPIENVYHLEAEE